MLPLYVYSGSMTQPSASPLHSTREKIAFLVVFVAAVAGAWAIHVEGTSERYLASFDGAASPVAAEMTRKERRVAKTLTMLGAPLAQVSTMAQDAPSPISGDGTPVIMEIPSI